MRTMDLEELTAALGNPQREEFLAMLRTELQQQIEEAAS